MGNSENTRREREVQELGGRRGMAVKPFVSLRPADTRRFNITREKQVKNAAGLIKEAYKSGLL
ncbi:hypothetical protein EG028_07115 [Chitinophaga barathri]|uniref:Uncharacterized protein n=1 Tax=Chitinophaga barathri TaxID=1647451 RepID=A0A3N4MDB3_9BACT|nr:hypothetical protein EG028_07115 [Chitinophaga barathri]